MKSYLSSMLKSVLTVLIAVLIPVFMLAGCEKVPEERQTIENFLASDEASYITGQTLHVNGGMQMI